MTALSTASVPFAVGASSHSSSAAQTPSEQNLHVSSHPTTSAPDTAAAPDAHSTLDAAAPQLSVEAALCEQDDGHDRFNGTSPTTADKPGVSSSTTLELASPSSETMEDTGVATLATDGAASRPKPRARPSTGTASNGPATAPPASKGKSGATPPTATQRAMQLMEQYLSADAIQRGTEALARERATSTQSEDARQEAAVRGGGATPAWLDEVRPVLGTVDSHVTIPLLSLLQIEPLMAVVRAGLDESAATAAASQSKSEAQGRATATANAASGKTSHSVLQQICFLLEALRLSKQLLVRDDLPVSGAEPAVLLPVDACELRQFRVGPISHAGPGVRCTLLLECAGEDAAAVQTLAELAASRLDSVLHDSPARAVIVTCLESADCLAVTFSERHMAREGFTQLQECAPYKAGLLTVRMRVESQGRAGPGPSSSVSPGSASPLPSGGAPGYHGHGLPGNVSAVGAGHRRWAATPQQPQRHSLALARALSVASAAAAERVEPSGPAIPAPRFATARAAETTAAAKRATTAPRSLAPAPIDDEMATPPRRPAKRGESTMTTTATASSSAAAAAAAPSQSGLNLEAAPFVPRSLRGLGGSMDELDYDMDSARGPYAGPAPPEAMSAAVAADAQSPMLHAASSSGPYGMPGATAWPAHMDESERLVAQMLLDSQNGIIHDPFGGVPPQPVVPWGDYYGGSGGTPHALQAAPAFQNAPPAALGDFALPSVDALGGDNPRSARRHSTHSPVLKPPTQPHAVDDDDALTPPVAPLAPPTAIASSPPPTVSPAGSARAAFSPPQPPAPLLGDEAASLSDSQVANSSASRRWRRHNPYNMSSAAVETSAPSSPSPSLTSDQQQQRTPLYGTTLLTPGSSLGQSHSSPTFVNPSLRARDRSSRLSTAFSSANASTDVLSDAVLTQNSPRGDRKLSARALTYAEVLQQSHHHSPAVTTKTTTVPKTKE